MLGFSRDIHLQKKKALERSRINLQQLCSNAQFCNNLDEPALLIDLTMRVVQLAEHQANITKVVDSIPAVVKRTF